MAARHVSRVVVAVVGMSLALGCSPPPSRTPSPDWMKVGKLAGFATFEGMSDAELGAQLDALVKQHVDIVVADSKLSNYLQGDEFARHLALVGRVSSFAHDRGLKLIWYITSLEVQTVDGKNRASTMAKDHPDWLQVGLDDKKNVFYGTQEVWVEGTDESAWMCPLSGYRDYFLGRVRQLAGAGLDGLWVDVPLFMDTGVRWNCRCPLHQKKFKADTGYEIPKGAACDSDAEPGTCVALWKDPAWRRWLAHRHDDLNEFQLAVAKAAREVKPDFETVFEVFTMDYNDAMDKGLDGAYLGAVEGAGHAWEIDSVSNGEGMLRASAGDWVNKIALTKFARGADKGRATWAFSYGNTELDAGLVMAILFAGQANPYETKTPQMATTVGAAFRARMYAWADQHTDAIYRSQSAARVALLFSSRSRDYVDYNYGFAMFSGTTPPKITGVDPQTQKPYTGPDEEWWSDERRDSVDNLEVLGDFRGFVKALVHLHVPFAVEAIEKLTAADLAGYDTVIAPSPAALTDEQAKLLTDYVAGGGDLIVTGPQPGGLDGFGTPRVELAIAGLLGFGKATPPGVDERRSHPWGQGSVHTLEGQPGRRYLRHEDARSLARIRDLLGETTSSPLTTTADKAVYLELYRLEAGPGHGDELVLHLVNLAGLDGSGQVVSKPQQVSVTLEVPAGFEVDHVALSSPDQGSKDAAPSFQTPAAGLVKFDAAVDRYALARVALKQAAAGGAGLTVKVSWPGQGAAAPPLAAAVRVSGAGLLGPRVHHLSWGTAETSFTDLPPGQKLVEVITLDSQYQLVGAQGRGVTLPAGGSATIAVTPGVAADEGPTALEAQDHDRLFFVNGTGAPAKVTAGALDTTLAAGKVATLLLEKTGALAFSAGKVSGTITVQAASAAGVLQPQLTAVAPAKGYAGQMLTLTGSGFGWAAGAVRWGGASCRVLTWAPERVTAVISDGVGPGTAAVTLDANGRSVTGGSFTVVAPALTITPAMSQALGFIKTKMRGPEGGVYTNLLDRADPPGGTTVYPYGHHQTAEHIGLMLWVTAALLDHQAFEETYRFLVTRMVSPRREVVNWAVDKTTGQPMLQRETPTAPLLNSNAPLDDFRVVQGLIAGFEQWGDERFLDLALRIGDGLRETSVTTAKDLLAFPDGLVAYAYNWPEEGGLGVTDSAVIPVDYADLFTMKWLAGRDARWTKIVTSSIAMMEKAQIASSGQFWCSYLPDTKTYSGDFEYRDTPAATKIKSIQSLWIALHLARAGRTAAASKALAFYKQHYAATGKTVGEYLNPNGQAPTESYFDASLKGGEARIYALLVRLAYALGDKAFGDQVITEKLLPDQVTNPAATTYGAIGKSTAEPNDAEAWNTLESLLALALQQGSPVVGELAK